jgi:sphinganine-1-phosphate aldolase
MKAWKRQIDSNTIMLVASGPDYPYGNFDPTPEIAALAKKWGIGCHSDCCLGSFINPFAEKAGFKQPHYVDFRIPGVTSISVDPHKYGLGPKGVSICLFRDSELRSQQFFATMSWNGGFYATPNMAGSRPGNVVAGTWAVMMKIGESGYLENAKLILSACSNLKKAIMAEVPEVVVATR